MYISGPLTGSGYFIDNIRHAVEVGARLLDEGYAPYIPHLNCFWEVAHPRPYETWMQLDLEWIKRCNALIRLPGVSPGGDREVACALTHGIPVFFGVESFLGY